jgi:phosphoadenylyl-sulfate reductase (thioredoxin)
MLCCSVRKVRPLERKLEEFSAWVTGLRRGQSALRAELPKLEIRDGRAKISPLAGWTSEELEEYLERRRVPRHPLYARGYTSIGCAPCTRATEAGEDERAGRWWWEQDADKECGIHFSAQGRAERRVDVLLRELTAA